MWTGVWNLKCFCHDWLLWLFSVLAECDFETKIPPPFCKAGSLYFLYTSTATLVQRYALFMLINGYSSSVCITVAVILTLKQHYFTSIRTHCSHDGSVPHDFFVCSSPPRCHVSSAVYLSMSEHTETVCSFDHLYLENPEWRCSRCGRECVHAHYDVLG